MLVITGCAWQDDDTGSPWVKGFGLWLNQIPIRNGLRIGVGGGFMREHDARIAERCVREKFPEFDFDNCNLAQFSEFYKRIGERELRKVMTEHLQW